MIISNIIKMSGTRLNKINASKRNHSKETVAFSYFREETSPLLINDMTTIAKYPFRGD